jgi:hypothetical protein
LARRIPPQTPKRDFKNSPDLKPVLLGTNPRYNDKPVRFLKPDRFIDTIHCGEIFPPIIPPRWDTSVVVACERLTITV